MRSPLARGLVALGAIAVVVVLFVVLAGGDDNGGSDNTTSTQSQAAGSTGTAGASGATGAPGKSESKPSKPQVPTIEVVDGKPQGGIQRLTYAKGDPVKFAVKSDVADEIHVHGYDLKQDVPAGGTVRFSFPASIEGVFEVELEGRAEQIAELRVTPG